MNDKKQKSILDLLLHSAKGFYDVGFNCAYNLSKDNGITGFQRIASGAVNMSFSAELFLKAVHLITSNKSIKGHELLDLFNDLPTNSKAEIEERFNYHLENNDEAKLLPSHRLVISQGDSKANAKETKDNNLKNFLTLHNLTFQNWRYMHEVKNVGYSYEADFKKMDCFIKSLIDFINSNKNKSDLILQKQS
ncbi:hypothetical protein [Tenacibaculum sp.]|uniref:hypothetical protein n=1 Tax=Tenacibaculum sp. TaxID=1906242 RepID=UPI003D0F40E1